jgi:hypothetical protein
MEREGLNPSAPIRVGERAPGFTVPAVGPDAEAHP